ncbi:TRC40/GET3/ArsA family transport-energizing ATPase [Halorussus sp. MSC15.2]|uniref:ArsA family ATPase n=1 Tax=Halorussus sp. MSC15.2 TaxID=2283638 RepID=UPI0013D1F064|nr:TRC40/GET3/ArsA family transport-energizing ATPase [Halorussus sp. MSC15.2]NEU57528.1 TRC40/GET3/ArsA family transport-energizing ATPase [Halorussus sp. MSC15.2]
MTELDVEPVERIDESDVPAGIDAPEYVLYGGKGGVGKTTMAAATGLASARGGTATLVVSTDPAHSLSDTFETEIPATPERIREDVPLYAAEIDPDAALEEGDAVFGGAAGGAGTGGPEADPAGSGVGAGDQSGPLGGLGEMLGEGNPMDALLGGPMPGADEAAAMQKLLEYMDDPRFERVVVDTAPTGHTLRLLELPELMDTMLGRIMKLKQKFQGMMEGMKGMFGGEDADPEQGFDDLDELSDRIERLRDTLRDPSKTDFRVVLVPEEMSVFESERLLDQLSEFGVPVGTVVVNKVMEDLADVVEPRSTAGETESGGVTSEDTDAFVSPNLDTCEFCQRRWEVQQDALARAQDVFRGHDVKRVPLLADEVRGERMLALVASCLD